MSDERGREDQTPPELYTALEHHLHHFMRVENILLGTSADSEKQTETWLVAVLDTKGAAVFAAESKSHLFASLIMFLMLRQQSAQAATNDDQLEDAVEIAAAFAGIPPESIRRLLLPAHVSFRTN